MHVLSLSPVKTRELSFSSRWQLLWKCSVKETFNPCPWMCFVDSCLKDFLWEKGLFNNRGNSHNPMLQTSFVLLLRDPPTHQRLQTVPLKVSYKTSCSRFQERWQYSAGWRAFDVKGESICISKAAAAIYCCNMEHIVSCKGQLSHCKNL